MQLPEISDTFAGRYRIDEELGRGGFAVVFRATDRNGGVVALKIIRGRDASPGSSTRARFEREALISSALTHHNTVRLLDHGESGGLLYLCFELLGGEDLSDVLHRQKLSPRLTRQLMRQVLESLGEAHQAGLIHRDLKPENIRVLALSDDEIVIKVMDFGIARPIDGSHGITQTGELLGTPRYMSPEQLMEGHLGPQTDLYSLGVIAFECVMGRTALHGTSWAAQLERLQTGHLFSAPELAKFDRELLDLLGRMTSRHPDSRPASASAALAMLDGNAPAPAALARPSGRANRLWPVAAIIVTATIGGGVWYLSQDSESQRRRRPIRSTSQTRLAQASADPQAPQKSIAAPDVATQPDAGTCGVPPLEQREVVGGTVRYVPRGFDTRTPHPALILIHTDYQSPAQLLDASGFIPLAEQHGFVIIAPHDPTPEAGIPTSSYWREETDVAAIRQAYNRAADDLCLDRTRTFVVATGDGVRAGAPLACEPFVTAFAAHSWLWKRHETGGPCRDRHVPTIWLNPATSNRLAVRGGTACASRAERMSTQELRDGFVKLHGCKRRGAERTVHEGGTCERWSCATAFELCVLNGGEDWPGTRSQNIVCPEPEPPDFPVAERIWQFFESIESTSTGDRVEATSNP